VLRRECCSQEQREREKTRVVHADPPFCWEPVYSTAQESVNLARRRFQKCPPPSRQVPALPRESNGRYTAKPSDTLLRVLKVPSSGGTEDIAVRGSRAATQVAEYWNAVHRYLETGDASRLVKFSGKFIKDASGKQIPLPADRTELNRLG